MLIEIDTVKGFQDHLPPESIKRRKVQEIIESAFIRHGFNPIETPVIEQDELMRPESLENEGEDSAVSDRFRLKDRGGRNLGLRYEFTFQLARILKQNPNLKLPFRRYQIGPVFRDEPIGPSRYRQFTQCDADIIGDSSVTAEAELFSLAQSVLKELNIDFEIEVNNRKLLNSIIESVEIKASQQVLRELDKLDKIGEDQVKTNLKKYADTNQVITLFKLLEKDISFFKENKFDGIEELDKLQSYCKKYGIKIKFNPFLVRGFGYYTGTIFEIKQSGKNTIVAGGRYDKTVGKYLHKEIPAVGISFGLDRVSELATLEEKPLTNALIISISQDLATIKLTQQLRNLNLSVVPWFEKTGKGLEYANAYSIPYVIFLGEDEVKKKKYKLRDMRSGVEKNVTEKQLPALLKKI